MRKLIVIPKLHGKINAPYVNRNFMLLFKRMRDELGFEIIVEDHIEVPKDVELIITFKAIGHSNIDTLIELADLDKKIKLITIVSDLHFKRFWNVLPDETTYYRIDEGLTSVKNNFTASVTDKMLDMARVTMRKSFNSIIENDRTYIVNMHKMCNRADLILTRYWKPFELKYPEYIEKAVHFPHFCINSTHLKFNENPITKCLLTGAVSVKVYPIREYIVALQSPNIIVKKVPHNQTSQTEEQLLRYDFYINDSYINLLNSHVACFATSSKLNYTVGKYFEIPATGSLLLCIETDDLEKLGFIPFEHYVPFTIDTLTTIVDDIVTNPTKYRSIRLNGMNFVRSRHSINNRFDQLKELLVSL